MSGEMEVAGAASIGGVATKQKADLSGKPCLNCGSFVEERYCTVCGQLAASFHRPIWSLIGETITDTLALDGRLARTIPRLFFRPGALTKAYISGQRARYVPPFRLFLLASLVFYFVLFAIIGNASWMDDLNIRASGGSSASTSVTPAEDPPAESTKGVLRSDGTVNRELIKEAVRNGEAGDLDEGTVDLAADAFENPRLLLLGIEKWAPRLSFFLVPSTIFSLTLLHFWRRRIYIYDHAIHALHLHTWMYLVGALAMGAGMLIGGWTGWIFLIALIVYVWRSLAVVGETGIFMSGWRLFSLMIGWVVMIVLLAVFSVVLGAVAL